MKKITTLLATLALFTLGSFLPALAFDGTTIFLVRHAEKADDGTSNPPLTDVGEKRAGEFAKMLHGKNVTHIFSTPFKRTMDTAKPTAHEHGLEIKEYDPRDSQGLVDKLKTLEGTILVTGHSNTTPGLVNLLTGKNLKNLDERIYDMVYIVTLDDNGNGILEITHSRPRTPLN